MAEIIAIITFLSFAISFLLTPVTILLANRFKLVDNPKTRPHPAHTHKGIIPRAGGMPVLLGIFIPFLIMFPLTRAISGIVICAAILIVIGLWDDKKDRSPYIRFLAICFVAFLAVVSGISIPYITNPFGTGVIHLNSWGIPLSFFGFNIFLSLAEILAFIWILWTTNIVGWSGGIDGQLPGFVAISSLIIGLLSLRFAASDPQQLYVSYLSFATTAAFIGFLPWNYYPQKIMPGYGGKTLAGFMLGILSVLSFSKVGTALLVLAVPMSDAVFMILRRLLVKRSPVLATSDHLHHHLLNLGWGRRRIAFFYWGISAIAGTVALVLSSKQKIFAGVLILVLVAGLLFWLNFLTKLPVGKKEEDI